MKKAAIILSLFATVLFSCSKDDKKEPTPVVPTAKVMFVNGSAASGNADVKLNDATLDGAQNIGFTSGTGYLNLTPGNSQSVKFFDDNGLPLGNGTYNFAADQYYSVFSGGSIQTSITYFTTDDRTPPASGKAKVRFINLSNANLTVDFYVGSNVLDSNIVQGAGTPFREVTANTYNLIANDPTNVPLSPDTSGVSFSNGKIYTVIMTGLATGTGNNQVKMSVIANN